MEFLSCLSIKRAVTAAALMFLFVACIQFYLKNEELSFYLHADVEWDLDSIKESLSERVIGQEAMPQQLLDALYWTIKDEDALKAEANVKVVFLLGGPGVGKTQVCKTQINTPLLVYFLKNIFSDVTNSLRARDLQVQTHLFYPTLQRPRLSTPIVQLLHPSTLRRVDQTNQISRRPLQYFGARPNQI
jgi:hypothetical protein